MVMEWDEIYKITSADFVFDEYIFDRGWEYIELEYGTSPDENIFFRLPKSPRMF